MRFAFRICVVLVLLVVGSNIASAHSMYQSAVLLDFRAHDVAAEMQLPVSRVTKVLGGTLSPTDVQGMQSKLQSYIVKRVSVRSNEGQPWSVRFMGPVIWQVIDGAPYLVAHFQLSPPAGSSDRQFLLTDDVLTDTISNQVVLVSVRSDWQNSTFANDPELLGILNGQDRFIAIDRASGTWLHGFASVFHLGLRHIAEGTDHLLFLLALLLPAPLFHTAKRWTGFAGVRHGFAQILKVVTAFTLGHSVTLALAAFGLVHVPSRPIEILIAVSILVSAAHALRPLFPGKEALIAGSFGLIHGLAFATTLAELGLRGWERVASLLAFNLGIESMQLVVVLCIMPSLMLLSRTVLYRPFRMVGALFAGAAALGWIVERTFERSLHVDFVVDGLAQHAAVFALGLFVTAIIAFYWNRRRIEPLAL